MNWVTDRRSFIPDVLLIVTALMQFGAIAQETTYVSPALTDIDSTMESSADILSLAECITLALENNLQHRSNLRQIESTREQLRRARAPFELNADATLTVPNYTDERDTFDDPALIARFREENTRSVYSGQMQVPQRIPHAGRVSITGNTAHRLLIQLQPGLPRILRRRAIRLPPRDPQSRR